MRLVFVFVALFTHVGCLAEPMAMIQFVEGITAWSASGNRPAPKFQTLLYEHDRLDLKENALVKIVSNHLCVAVFYGPGSIQVPAMDSPWSIDTFGLRWICPHGHSERLVFATTQLEIMGGGEISYTRDNLLVRADLVLSKSQPLPSGIVYKPTSEVWTHLDPQPNEYNTWLLFRSLREPQEATPIRQPERVFPNRIILSAGRGSGNLEHAETDLNASNMKASTAQLQYQVQWKNKSLILSLGLFELEQNSSELTSGPHRPISRLKNTTADIGLRWNHEKNWSFFSKIGAGKGTLYSRGNLLDENKNFAQGFEIEVDHLSATLTLGVENFFFKDSIEQRKIFGLQGLYASVEINVTQSLSTTPKSIRSFTGPATTLPSNLTNGEVFGTGLLLRFGLPFGF